MDAVGVCPQAPLRAQRAEERGGPVWAAFAFSYRWLSSGILRRGRHQMGDPAVVRSFEKGTGRTSG